MWETLQHTIHYILLNTRAQIKHLFVYDLYYELNSHPNESKHTQCECAYSYVSYAKWVPH